MPFWSELLNVELFRLWISIWVERCTNYLCSSSAAFIRLLHEKSPFISFPLGYPGLVEQVFAIIWSLRSAQEGWSISFESYQWMPYCCTICPFLSFGLHTPGCVTMSCFIPLMKLCLNLYLLQEPTVHKMGFRQRAKSRNHFARLVMRKTESRR